MKKIYVLFFILCCSIVKAQNKSINFEISGILMDTKKKPLESATVFIEKKKDSSLVTYTLTNLKGKFLIEGKTKDPNINLHISYVGFSSFYKEIDLSQKTKYNLNRITLRSDVSELSEVILRTVPPITIKKDTIEFNSRSFKTKKDANVEDLIKKLPGAVVDENGQITINGKSVTKVLINGKPFFGNDPTIATRNLPKNIIEKVQVVDSKTKSESFTGELSNGENKTINLVIKRENNKGVFGRASVGYGTDSRYQYAGMLNKFDNDEKLSFLAGGNNINSPGFNHSETRNMANDHNSSRGITISDNAGVNYSNEFGKNIDFSSNYFFSKTNIENESSSEKETILEDRFFFDNSRSNTISTNKKHTANLELDIKKNSTWLINFAPSFNLIYADSDSFSNNESLNEEKDTINTSRYTSMSESSTENFSSKFNVTKKYGSMGGFVRLGSSVKIDYETQDESINSETIIINNLSENVIRNQFNETKNESQETEISLTFRQPIISQKLFLDINYVFDKKRNLSDKKVYNYDNDSELYSDLDSVLSTDYININQSHIPGFSISYRGKKLNIRSMSTYRYRTIENNDDLRPEFSLKRSFKNYEQRTNFKYKLNTKSSVNVNYRYQNRPPLLRYLQTFEDVSNPTNTIIGNPNLKPQVSHGLYVYYNYNNFQKKFGFNGYLSGDIIDNKTVLNRYIDDNNISTTTYANVNGNYHLSGRLEVNKKININSKSTLEMILGIEPSYSRNINYNNSILYNSTVSTVDPFINLRYDWRSILEFYTKYIPQYSETKYNLESLKSQNQNFTMHRLSLNTVTKIPKRLEWNNSLNYNYNPNLASGFQKSSWFWNMTLSYSILKEKGLISFKAYDVLNQNTDARRRVLDNSITDSTSIVLKQYFMFGFNWKLNTLKDRTSPNRYRSIRNR